jgi:hypothetical protein
LLGSRRLCWLSRGRGDCLSACCVASPDKPPLFVLSYWMHVEKFIFQVFEVIVVKVKTSLESPIGDTSLAFQ